MHSEIVTERLSLRRARPDDLDALHALVSDFEVVRDTATWPWPADRKFTAARCEPVDSARGLAGPVLKDGEIIGLMGVLEGEMGYMFARRHWGQGHATEIGRALLAHAFATYDWPRIEAGVFDGNPASARVLEKLGFAPAGDDRLMCAAAGQLRPLTEFHLTREDWEGQHG